MERNRRNGAERALVNALGLVVFLGTVAFVVALIVRELV
jgi:hypothetical protein